MRRLHTAFSAFFVLFALVCTTPSAYCQAVTRFDLPAEPLADALRAVGSQAKINVLFDPPLVAGYQSSALKANLTVDQAITRLLAGTGIKHEFLNETTVVIGARTSTSVTTPQPSLPGTPPAPPATATDRAKNAPNGLRVAQVDQGASSRPSPGKTPTETSPIIRPEEKLSEVVVTGTRIPQRGDGAQLVRTYSREDIDESGSTTITDFLNTLPDVSISLHEGNVQTFVGQTTVQLHGLPAGTTLVLLDGQHVETGGDGFFDLSNIPLAMIERIDVVPVGSSAIYGSDALAGAVNFILRKDFDGSEFNAKYGAASGTHENDLNAAWGKVWGNKGSVSIVGNYQSDSPLLGNQRKVVTSTLTPAGTQSPSTFDFCNPGNVYSVTGQNLPGLNAPNASVPRTPNGRPTISDFQATAGQTHLCTANNNIAFIPDTERGGLLATGHYEFSPAFDVFSKLIFAKEAVKDRVGDLITLFFDSFTAGAKNPYNPFGEDVFVNYVYDGLPRSYANTQQFLREEVGARGDLIADWQYEVTASWSKDRSTISIEQTSDSVIQNALNSSDPSTALNPFTTGVPASPALLQLIQATAANNQYIFDDKLTTVQAIARGTLFSLPGGRVYGILGAEWHDENVYSASPFGDPSNLGRHDYGLFTEERIPIVAGSEHTRGGEKLALTVAGRYDNSSDFGGKRTWQTGLEYRPISSLLFRGGYATSYEAPQLSQIEGGIFSTFDEPVTDPARGGQTYDVTVNQGANPNLRPETGTSLTAGFVYTSDALPGLQTSFTWYDIKLANYIGIFGDAQTVVTNANLFPGALVRKLPSSQDIMNGFLGQISSVSDVYFNFGSFDISGVDVDAKYRISTAWGTVSPAVAFTYTYKWQSALTPGTPAISYLDQASAEGPGFAPRFKGTASLTWSAGPYVAALGARYISRYKDYQDFGANTNQLGNFWIADANVRWNIGANLKDRSGFLNKTYLEVGAVNLLNELPQRSFNYNGYDPNEGDLRGRFVYVQIGFKH